MISTTLAGTSASHVGSPSLILLKASREKIVRISGLKPVRHAMKWFSTR
jgi:hypothetical protein